MNSRALHAIAIDSRGRLFLGDRDNNRIQIYDQDGKYLDCWYQFSRPSGIFIDADDNIFVTDSESREAKDNGRDLAHPGWQRGIRIGSAKDGSVNTSFPILSPRAAAARRRAWLRSTAERSSTAPKWARDSSSATLGSRSQSDDVGTTGACRVHKSGHAATAYS